MNKEAFTIAAILLVSSILTFQFMTAEPLSQAKPVDRVDPNRYVGRWYEQAVIPYYFERGCSQTQAVYSLIDSKTIKVDNACVRNGKKQETVGKAYV